MDVGAWLRGLGLGQYEQAFRDNDVDERVLAGLTAEDLKEIGVASVGHRRMLLQAAEALREPPPPAQPQPAPDLAPQQAERRQLTVMFVDLVGSTALSRRLDPEEMREVIRAYQNAVAGEVARFEGHVAKFMGDGVLAYFGWPRAHEDEAERAVRAALAIAAAVPALRHEEEQPLAARVGIATGLVVVGDLLDSGAAREEAVIGETPNLAARLQATAPPGRVVLAEGTRRLLGAAFELAPVGPLELAGFAEPVRAFRVTGEGRAEGRFEARHAGGPAPMHLVGREHELALLLDRWRLAKGGEGQVVLLCGEPGIGKSRVVLALRERLRTEPRTSLRFHGSPFHAQSALWPVTAQLERVAGLEPRDSPEAKLDKLEALLGHAVTDVPAVAPLLAELLGLATHDRYPPQDRTPQQRKAQTFRALLGQLEGLARQRPVLVVLEDAHWLDPTTLELFEVVVGRIERLPVLLVVTFRPEFRAPWLGRAHVTLLTLSRLGRSQAAEVVMRVTGGRALPGEILDQILAKTDGIPLFVEELTKMVLEAGLLRSEGERYVLDGPLPPLAIPDTLYGSLLARLDRLAPVKEVAQIGAVIGREFDHELLAAAAGMDEGRLAAALRQLVEAELVFPRGVPPEATYAFKHALVQEVAYGSLLKGRRQQLHARIAQELERRFPGTVARQPEVLAHHLTEAGLPERALELWGRAGALALARSAGHEAAAHLGKALQLAATLPSNDEMKRREIDLHGGLSAAFILTRGLASPEVERAQLRARELAFALGDGERWFRAQWGLWRVYCGRARSAHATHLARELLEAAERDGDVAHLLQAHHALWTVALFRGDLLATKTYAERGRSLYDPERHAGHVFVYGGHDPCECALNQGGNALWFLGYPDQAQRWHDEALALALSERLGLPQVLAHTLNWTAIRTQLAGDLPSLEAQVERVTRLAAEHGFANWIPEARILAGWMAARRDRDRGALASMRRHLDQRAASSTVFAQTWLWLMLADACLAVGASAEALAAVRDGLAAVEATEERFCEAELHRVHAAALLAHDRAMLPEAERALLQALDAARAHQARMSELRAANDLVGLWADAGRRREARDLLAPVHAWFTEGFDTPDLKEAEALLDALP